MQSCVGGGISQSGIGEDLLCKYRSAKKFTDVGKLQGDSRKAYISETMAHNNLFCRFTARFGKENIVTFHDVDQLLPGMKADIRNFRDAQCQSREYKMMESFHDGDLGRQFSCRCCKTQREPLQLHCENDKHYQSDPEYGGGCKEKTDRFDDIV